MIDSLACAFVKLIGAFFCRLSPSLAVWVGERLGDLAYGLAPKRTRIGILNLRAAFDGRLSPAQARRCIRACYRQLGASFVELLRLPVIDETYLERYISIENYERFEEAVSSDRPVILITGHYGNWELSSIVAALKGHPIVALARAQSKLPKLYRLLVSYRESKGCRVIHKGGAMRRLIAALEAREPIGIVGDQASRQGAFVDFFGRAALFASGPFDLAHAKDALIVPAFIRRLRGPFHRLVVETPIRLPRHLSRDKAIRFGLERFADVLAHHIREDPAQWLWMHKRWKHTSARRALVLSDGKAGHLKQSLAIIEALRELSPGLTHEVIEVRYRHPVARLAALLWSIGSPGGAGALSCLRWTLAPPLGANLLSRYADLIVSCGASTAPVNLLWAAENRAKSVAIMNPSPIPLRRFDLVIAPEHDALPQRRNVVETVGAVAARISEERLWRARERLSSHPLFRAEPNRLGGRKAVVSTPAGGRSPSPKMESEGIPRKPAIALFIGGETAHYTLEPAFAEALVRQIKTACEAVDGWCLVTTSRRTSSAVERLLRERFGSYSRCRLLLIASQDAIDGTMEGMLGFADVAVVTGESVSMVSETLASGRAVVVIEPPLRDAAGATPTKQQRLLQDLARRGLVRRVPMPEVALAIQRALKAPGTPVRADNFAKIREALAPLVR